MFNVVFGDVEFGFFIFVSIIVYNDKFFIFEMKMLLVFFFLKKVVKFKRGGGELGCVVVGFVIMV